MAALLVSQIACYSPSSRLVILVPRPLKIPVKIDHDMADLEVKYLWELMAGYLAFS